MLEIEGLVDAAAGLVSAVFIRQVLIVRLRVIRFYVSVGRT